MVGTLLFVHGTGVRAAGYSATTNLIRTQAAQRSLPLHIRGCNWGASQGARLEAQGASIPGYIVVPKRPTESEEALSIWSVLYTDPWHELRLLQNRPHYGQAVFGTPPASTRFREQILSFSPSPLLLTKLGQFGLDRYFEDALETLRASPELVEAATTATDEPIEHRRVAARSIIAATLADAEDDGLPVIDGYTRDKLLAILITELHGADLSVTDFMLRPIKGLALRLITRKLVGDRGTITEGASPLAGDILRFLANGARIRTVVTSAIQNATPPVHLLGHSLGGVICTDLLVRNRVTVESLITVGSQTPYLYEIDAFPSLQFNEPLPNHFPRWLNIYDRTDVLSFIGADIFHGRVKDIQVDNGQPFPQAHSAYWTNAQMWAAIEEFLI